MERKERNRLWRVCVVWVSGLELNQLALRIEINKARKWRDKDTENFPPTIGGGEFHRINQITRYRSQNRKEYQQTLDQMRSL